MEAENIQPSFEIQRFIEKFDQTSKAYMVMIMETGARVSDTSKIRVKDIKDRKGKMEESEDELLQ